MVDNDFPPHLVLAKPLMAHLASASPQGPRDSPVWFLWESPALWLVGRSTDSFICRLRADHRCAVGVVDLDVAAGLLRHVGVRGLAELLPMDSAILTRLMSRYLGSDPKRWRKDFVTRVIAPLDVLVCVRPDSIVCRDQSYFK